ncbi:MAG: YraN family protein [Nitrospira sp.]|nr:YraN family protein [Nitrospira sp.]
MSADLRQLFGRQAESEAEALLRRKGYKILGRNVRSSVGELDLVAKDGEVLVFVEVKARQTEAMGGAIHAVDGRKRAKLIKLASQYLAQHSLVAPVCRFDVVVCQGGRDQPGRLEHIQNAFEVPADELRP